MPAPRTDRAQYLILNKRFKEVVEFNQLSFKDIAKELGLSVTFLVNMTKNRKILPKARLDKLAQILHMTPKSLLGLESISFHKALVLPQEIAS